MKFLITILISFFLSASAAAGVPGLLNTAHLDHLYEDVVAGTDTIGIIHIYAEYPDYKWVTAEGEGKACIDDAARALVFYIKYYQLTKNAASLGKIRKLLNFVFYMQSENGFFYNFIFDDNSINKKFRTSINEPNWWSWRSLWALSEAGKFYKDLDHQLYKKCNVHMHKLLKASAEWLTKNEKYSDYSGFSLPAWLPYETASDQSAIILKGLNVYYQTENDSSVIPLIKMLSKGILKMQAGDKKTFPYYAFLSWQNTWHGWGNSQADALLAAGKILKDTLLIGSALNEIKYFYPYQLKEKFLTEFSVSKKNKKIKIIKKDKYPQIAYCLRPMIFASISAYEVSGNNYYAELAGKIACWFFGANANKSAMYNPETGACFDGIISDKKVNKNSGAESTIECLLSLVTAEENPVSRKIIDDYYKSSVDTKPK